LIQVWYNTGIKLDRRSGNSFQNLSNLKMERPATVAYRAERQDSYVIIVYNIIWKSLKCCEFIILLLAAEKKEIML
jgi:hypothetical protein